jgi:hypothetical protein
MLYNKFNNTKEKYIIIFNINDIDLKNLKVFDKTILKTLKILVTEDSSYLLSQIRNNKIINTYNFYNFFKNHFYYLSLSLKTKTVNYNTQDIVDLCNNNLQYIYENYKYILIKDPLNELQTFSTTIN